MAEEVVVVGAGVIGLTLAYQLSTDPRFKVRVVSKSLPIDADVDYTSQYAGANWRSVCANDDYRMIALEEATLHYFREFSKHHPELVNECMSYDFFDPREPDANDRRIVRETDVAGGEVPWFERICKRFHTLPKEDLPSGVAFAIGFDTVTINAPEYIKWLYEQCLENKVTFEVRTIGTFDELDDRYDTVFNCTGLASRSLCKDEAVYPTRGQTVLVKNTTNLKDTLSRVGQHHLSYLIPRPGDGGLIIGGCQQPGNESYAVDSALADTMLHWAKTLYPTIFPADHAFQVLKHNVGLRPSRRGGVRIESERVGGRTLIHGYGIGGWGFQSSWGVARKMRALLEEKLHGPDRGAPIVFTRETALAKVKRAQALWNTRDASAVVKAYTDLSVWRNRTATLHGHAEIEAFLSAKWHREHNYRLRKELFSFADNRIAVEFWYEYSAGPSEEEDSQWFRCYGIEHWVFASDGRMRSRQMSGNEIEITHAERWFRDDDVDSVVLPTGHYSM